MGHVLILLEHQGGKLKPSALSAINFGKQAQQKRGGKLILLLLGDGVSSLYQDVAGYGADEVITVEDARLSRYSAELYAPILVQIAQEKNISFIGGIATSIGKDLFPRVAGLLRVGFASDVSQIVDHDQFRRSTHASNLWQTVRITTNVVVVTARQAEFLPVLSQTSDLSTQTKWVPTKLDSLGVEVIETVTQLKERPDLADARIVVSGGRGLKEKQNFILLEQICDLLGAALGASRAACDAGLVPNDLQVGQTGKVVAPDLYIAIGISGAIQHLAGMKGSKVIVAINKDAEAPIFQVADYGLVSTWEKALPELIDEIKKLQRVRAAAV